MQAPPDTQCANHPGTSASTTCSRCGTFVCAACTSFTGGAPLCVNCSSPYIPRGSRGARFVANLIDSAVVSLPAIGCILIFVVFSVSRGNEKPGDLAALFLMGGMFLGVALGLGVQIVMQLRYAQSVGKRMMKLKVVRSDGSPVELWRIILLRNLALQVAAQLCGFVGIIDALMIFGDEMRCLHDLVADTVVVDVSAFQS
ncbi:MAG: RDD family protein [Myxococcales bacterium]|nr:RDD family protein [Myxococcales bacterium]